MHRATWRILSLVALAAVAVVAGATAHTYGVTWDEEYQRLYGDAVLNWYLTLFADRTALDKWSLQYYGGFFDLITQSATRFSPIGLYETRHALTLAFGLLGLVATFGLGNLLAGAAGSFFAVVLLALTPVYYGQMITNPKDIPFASLFASSLYLMLWSLRFLPQVPRRYLMLLGAVIGLTLGVRIGGIVLLAYLAVLWGTWAVNQHRYGARVKLRELAATLGRLLRSFLLTSATAWGVMLLFWPWAQVSPVLHPLEAIGRFASYGWPMTVLFDGRQVPAEQLPASYIPTWLAISLPEFYLLAAPLCVGTVLRYLSHRDLLQKRFEESLKVGLLMLAFVFPVGVAIVHHSTLYDGLRQFLFVLPPLAALCGSAVASFVTSRARALWRVVLAATLLVSAGLTVSDMVDLHPYQYIYFNRAVAGGLENAATRFETDYYGASYKEGVLWLMVNYWPEPGKRVRVANTSMRFLTAYYIENNPDWMMRFVPVQSFERPDIVLTTTRWNRHQNVEGGRLIHTVTRAGVPLLYVFEVTYDR